MKKAKIFIISLTVILIVALSIVFVNSFSALSTTGSEGLTYHLSDDGTYYIVSNYNNGLKDIDLVIPEQYKGLPVKEIAVEGFAERKWIKSVSIPKTIVKIGHGAFSQTGITKVYYNAAEIADFDSRNWVFYPNTTSKTEIEVTIGKDVKRIPGRLFYPLSTIPTLNPTITKITFEEGAIVSEIGDYAFYNIDDTATISFPSSLKTIGDYAFYGNNFTTINFNEGLEEIGPHAFDNSKQVAELKLPNSIENVCDGAFRNCLKLEKVTSNAPKYKVVSKDTFKYCTQLQDVNISNIEEIGESAFEGCTSLATYDFPTVKKLGESAFKDCYGLTKIVLDINLESIGNKAFYECRNVSDIIVKCNKLTDLNVSNNVFYDCGSSTNGIKVSVEEGVVVVPKRLFLSTSNITKLPNISQIVINSSKLATIDDYAFGYLDAQVTYVGTKTMWSNVKVNIGNTCFAKVNCVKDLEV